MEQPESTGRVAVGSGTVIVRASLAAGRFKGAARFSFSSSLWRCKTVSPVSFRLPVPVLPDGCSFLGLKCLRFRPDLCGWSCFIGPNSLRNAFAFMI